MRLSLPTLLPPPGWLPRRIPPNLKEVAPPSTALINRHLGASRSSLKVLNQSLKALSQFLLTSGAACPGGGWRLQWSWAALLAGGAAGSWARGWATDLGIGPGLAANSTVLEAPAAPVPSTKLSAKASAKAKGKAKM